MNSVLVDFYNLHSQIKRLKETHIPMNEDERELLRFFENYAPHVVSKMTPEETRQIITSHILPIFSELLYITLPYSDDEESLQKVMAIINDEEFIQKVMPKTDLNSPLSHALTLFFTTLEGYKVIKRISWFESDDFDCFAEEHQHIKLLMDKYLDDGYFTLTGFDWLKSRMNRMGTYWMSELFVQRARGNYKNLRIAAEDKEVLNRQFRYLKSNNPFEFGISFGELFPKIYDEAISVLKGELDIQRCKLTECNNITLEKSYCSEKCYKRDVKRQKAKKIHEILYDLICQWLKLSKDEEWFKPEDGITASQLKEHLEFLVKEHLKPEDGWRYIEVEKKYMKNLTKIPFLGTSNAGSLSGYLRAPQVHTMLKKTGIHIKKTKQKHSNINRYRFISKMVS